MKVTKEELQKKLTLAEEMVEKMKNKSYELRRAFSSMLKAYRNKNSSYYSSEKEIAVLSWEEIAFEFGKLRAESDYSKLLEEKEKVNDDNCRLVDMFNKIKEENEALRGVKQHLDIENVGGVQYPIISP